jgi:hypothetical protein
MALDFGGRVGIAGLIMALFAIAAAYLWPDKKWIGWFCLIAAACLLLYWTAVEFRQHFGSNSMSLVITTFVGCVVGGALAALLWFSTKQPPDKSDHPEVAEVPSYDPNHGTRLAVSLTPSGIAGNVVPVTGAAIVLQNMGDITDQHVYIRMFTPTPILDIKIDSPSRVQIVSGGPGGIGPGGDRGLELSVPELLPHESRIIRVTLTPASEGDISINLSSDRCGKDCRAGVAIVRPTIGPEISAPVRPQHTSPASGTGGPTLMPPQCPSTEDRPYSGCSNAQVGQWLIDESDKVSKMATGVLQMQVRPIGDPASNQALFSQMQHLAKIRFSLDFKKCCLKDMTALREEAIGRIGPNAKDAEEQTIGESIVFESNNQMGLISPMVVNEYAPFLRKLGEQIKELKPVVKNP